MLHAVLFSNFHPPFTFVHKFPFSNPPHSSHCSVKGNISFSARASPALKQKHPMQKLIIQNKNGENLVGLLHNAGSEEIVVLCHGFRSSKDHATMLNLASYLEKEGISSFRFDFSGNGESDGTFTYAGYWKEAEDLRAVIEHLNQKNRAVKAILGHSKGGGVVLLYASKYHDIAGVVNVSGRYDLKNGIEERLGPNMEKEMEVSGFIDVKNKAGAILYRVTKESLEDRLSTDMHRACESIDDKCRVLSVHGSDDRVIPVQDAFDFAKIIPNHSLRIIQGADHCYTLHQDHLASVVAQFLKSVFV